MDSTTGPGSASTATRGEALQLYQNEELPSVYHNHDLSVASSTTEALKSSLAEGSIIVDWQGEDDATNPRNFSSWKKSINIACIFYLSLASYVPALLQDIAVVY